MNDDLVSKRVVEVYENAEINFTKSIAKQSETSPLINLIQDLRDHKIPVNEIYQIETVPLEVFSEKLGKLVEIPIPSCHIGIQPINCRILSSRVRKGMVRTFLF